MFNGTVEYVAGIEGKGLQFPSFDFDPNLPQVDHVEIESAGGWEIRAKVHLTGVASADDGRALAKRAIKSALDRLSYHQNLSIEHARSTGDNFMPVAAPPGTMGVVAATLNLHIAGAAPAAMGLQPNQLRPALETATPPGEKCFGMFRSALQSESPVEAFMSLYQILMMIYGDDQADLNAFIVSEEPGVVQTQHPKKRVGVREPDYSRMRNELAHDRQVNLDDTKNEMKNRLGGLIAITKRAIELNP